MQLRHTLIILLFLSIATSQQTFLAIHDFEGKGVSEIEASALTDRLRTEISNMGQVSIVERAEMEEILKEQGYQQTGCFTSECMVEVGKLIGAEKIVSGSISKVGNTFSVSARLINIETGEVENSITYDLSGVIDELLISGMRNVSQLLFTTNKEDYIELNTTYDYYENGQVKSEGQLIGDIKVGRWTYYHNNGRIQQIGSYRNNMQIGQWAYFYADGRKEKEGYFVDNILENHWSYFYPNGQKEKEGSYNVGEIDGQWTYYYSNGNIKKEGSYSSGKVDGEWKYYFQLGKKEKEGIYKNGKKNGRWIYFLKNGKISMEGSYVLNNKEGKWIVNHWGDKYFDSGHFIKDRKHGEWIRTNESSDTISVTFYKKGLLREAIFSIISKGGTIISVNCKIEYSNTLFHIKAASNGTLIEYYPSGQKKAEVFIKNYLVHGRRTNYDMEGKSMNYNDFFKGEGFYVNYYPNRILAMQGNCINFDGYSMIKVGKWAYADSSGKNVEYIIYDDEGNEIIE